MDDSEAGKQAGIAAVSNSNSAWLGKCIESVSILKGLLPESFTGEEMRVQLKSLGLAPNHPNAWGALTNHLARRGEIQKTGDYVKMKLPRSHARETPTWRFAA